MGRVIYDDERVFDVAVGHVTGDDDLAEVMGEALGYAMDADSRAVGVIEEESNVIRIIIEIGKY